ncbi:MAG: phosphatidylglycerophosphatase A family protein [Thalassotalea sp.]
MTSNKNINAKFNLKDPVQFLALGFGSGLAPKAPGTFGTLAAVPLFILCHYLSNINLALLIVVMAVVGIYLCGKTAEAVGVDDHPAIVWDEFVGFFITMYFSPVTWATLLVGFLLFRFFDILKPWPISIADKKLHGGFGIMLDDILAGLAALAIMQFIF